MRDAATLRVMADESQPAHASGMVAMGPTVGVLALQGAFDAHARLLTDLGARVRQVRTPGDLGEVDGLVIPGGESTTMTLGIEREGLAEPLRTFRDAGNPIFGTCAGMIMLDRRHLGLMDIIAERNAFGPQLYSFEQSVEMRGIDGAIRAIFIRAPAVADIGRDVTVLAEIDGRPIAVQQDGMLAVSFHPELADEPRLHQHFLELVRARAAVDHTSGTTRGLGTAGGRRFARRTRAPMLLLFDIDGTLLDLRATAAHRDAVYGALTTVFGLEDPAAAGVVTWGKTDLQIGREILAASGRSTGRFHERAEEYCRVAGGEFARLCAPDLTADVVAGMPDLLGDLEDRDDVLLGVLTGSVREIAELKLARAGLGRFFVRGVAAYGCEAEDRAKLPVIARSRAGSPTEPHPAERTWIIGDTPHDIRCAHTDGARCIAVTSGVYAASQLRSADHVAEATEELRSLLDLELVPDPR